MGLDVESGSVLDMDNEAKEGQGHFRLETAVDAIDFAFFRQAIRAASDHPLQFLPQ